MKSTIKVYLAGKISKNDWREELVPDLIYAEDESDLRESWPTLRGAIFRKFDYVGPYFIGDDHGCYHGPNSHGVGAYSSKEELAELNECVIELGGTPSKQVVQLCLTAIEQADVIFAWLDCATAYGTLVELGYAKAAGKKVLIGSPKDFEQKRDFWFARSMADIFVENSSPKEAFRVAFREATRIPVSPVAPVKKDIPVFDDPIVQKWNYQPARIREHLGNLEPITEKQLKYIDRLAKQYPTVADELLHIVRLELGSSAGFRDCSKGLATFVIGAFLGKFGREIS